MQLGNILLLCTQPTRDVRCAGSACVESQARKPLVCSWVHIGWTAEKREGPWDGSGGQKGIGERGKRTSTVLSDLNPHITSYQHQIPGVFWRCMHGTGCAWVHANALVGQALNASSGEGARCCGCAVLSAGAHGCEGGMREGVCKCAQVLPECAARP